MPYFDYWYVILVIPAMILSMIASASVKSTYAKYAKIASRRGMTGSQIAYEILCRAGINEVSIGVEELVEARKKANVVENIAERAKLYSYHVKSMMDKVRRNVDNLEMLIDDEMWPLPKYRELLFF